MDLTLCRAVVFLCGFLHHKWHQIWVRVVFYTSKTGRQTNKIQAFLIAQISWATLYFKYGFKQGFQKHFFTEFILFWVTILLKTFLYILWKKSFFNWKFINESFFEKFITNYIFFSKICYKVTQHYWDFFDEIFSLGDQRKKCS